MFLFKFFTNQATFVTKSASFDYFWISAILAKKTLVAIKPVLATVENFPAATYLQNSDVLFNFLRYSSGVF
jgi:hypothetical protein